MHVAFHCMISVIYYSQALSHVSVRFHSDVVLILIINDKMPTIDGILIFMIRIKCMLS